MRASSRGALKPMPGVDSPLLSAPEHPQGAAPLTCLAASLRRWCLSVVCRGQRAISFDLPMTLESIMSFSSSCACASADIWRTGVALRIESAWRVEALGRAGVALARLAGQCGIVVTPRGPGTLHVLCIPYELLGDKRVPSAELKKRVNFSLCPEMRV